LAISAATLIVASCNAPKTGDGGGGTPGGTVGHKPMKPGPGQKIILNWKQGAWWVKLNGGNDENPKTATIKLAKDTGPTMFEVSIEGKPAATFKNPDGLTVWEGAKSGTPGSTQILGPVVSSDGKKLIFFDLNQGDPVKLYYSLNLTDGTSVDPIVDNGGGGNMQ
jgi:hypothetical protein